eukprot:1437753-Rhodomonas_salina.1
MRQAQSVPVLRCSLRVALDGQPAALPSLTPSLAPRHRAVGRVALKLHGLAAAVARRRCARSGGRARCEAAGRGVGEECEEQLSGTPRNPSCKKPRFQYNL